MKIFIALSCTVMLSAGFLACGSNSSGIASSSNQQTDHKKIVQMNDNFFSPKDITISVGDTVVWVNSGSNQHTSTSGSGCQSSGLWNSGLLSPGQEYMAIFDGSHVTQTGTIPYYCIPHCSFNMTGTITVTP